MARWQTALIAALVNTIGGQALAGVTAVAPDVNRDGIVAPPCHAALAELVAAGQGKAG